VGKIKSNHFVIWVAILIVELGYFYGLLHRVHEQEETVFIVVVIVATLVVGSTVIRNSKNH
jgi:hypothetical protein